MVKCINNFTCNDDSEPLLINKQLLYDYKDAGDDFLIGIKRNLTRSLVDYHLFQELQEINNSFFVIIDYLDCGHYYNVSEVMKDKDVLKNKLNIFIKNCKPNVGIDIFDDIDYNCKQLMLVMQKLITIVTKINK